MNFINPKAIFFAFLLIFTFLNSMDSFAQERCGSQIRHNYLMQTDSAYKIKHEVWERELKKLKITSKSRSLIECSSPYFIPVAIHYDWIPNNEADRNKLIKLADNQIKHLNRAFNGLDCSGGNGGSGGNTNTSDDDDNNGCFKFKITNQNHPSNSGLKNCQPAVTFGGVAGVDYCPMGSTGPAACNLSKWQGYLNITVNDFGNSADDLGFGQSYEPGNPDNDNSISINSCAFGALYEITGIPQVLDATIINQCDNLELSRSEGDVVIHEVGHFLGLSHTFCDENVDHGANGIMPLGSVPDSCITITCDCDGINDTPPQAYANRGCPGGSAEGTMPNPSYYNFPHEFNNYMDYVDDECMTCFTAEQYERMQMTLQSNGNYKSIDDVYQESTCQSMLSYNDLDISSNTYPSGGQILSNAIVSTGKEVTFDSKESITQRFSD